MFNKYPYTDFHELNLDWFLEEFKKVTNKVTTLDATVQEFTNFVTNYFDNLDVQEEINRKLDIMAADGTLTALLSPLVDARMEAQDEAIDVLIARMDSFTNLAEGSTTGDAELIDARIGANGVTYPNAGDAIRGQTDIAMNDIMANQNEFVKLNISDMFLELELGSINTSNGTELASNTRQRSGMLPTSDTNLYVMYPYQIQLIYYDEFKQYAANSGGSWVSKEVAVNTAYAYYRIILRVNTDEDMSSFLPIYISRRENNQTVISQINKLNADVTGYYPFMYTGMLNVTNGDQNSRSTSVNRIITDFISDKYDKIVLDDDYEAYILYFDSSLTFVSSTGFVTGEFDLGTYDYIRIMVKNSNIGDFTG